MTTHFITAEIDLQAAGQDLEQAIQTELGKRGEPLRWAVTEVADGVAQVEAVVTSAKTA